MGHTRQQYEDRIRGHLGDLGILQRIPDVEIPMALEAALAQFAKDHPRYRTASFTGDGTAYTFDLTAEADHPWITGWSRVDHVEYPAGERPARSFDHRFWSEVDGVVTFSYDTPASTETVKIRYATIWPHPDDDPDTDQIPDIYATSIAALAASKIIRAKAVAAARQQSTGVATDIIQLDASSLFTAARELADVYEHMVIGRPETTDAPRRPAMAVSDVQPVFPRSLFHQRPDEPQ